jgi:spore germination protein KC
MRMVQIILLVSLVGNLFGCGFKDLDKRFFVTAVGVDKTKSKDRPWRVTLKLVIPTPKIEPGKENYQLVSEDSYSITDAVTKMKSKVDKELDFGHSKIIIIGKSLAQEDVSEVMDWFERIRGIQEIAYVMVGDPDAKAILEIKPKSERLPANALILSFGQVGTESPYIVTEYLFDLHRRLREEGQDPILPVVKAIGKENYQIDTAALLDKKKVKAILTPEETRVLNEIMYKVPKFNVIMDQGKDTLAFHAESSKIKYQVKTPPNAKPYVDFSISLSGLLEESKKRIEKDKWKTYEKEISETTEKRVTRVLKKVQSYQLDPVGFGLRYLASAKDPTIEKWKEIYPQLEFRVTVKTSLKISGRTF